MKNLDLSNLADTELVRSFAQAAREKGEAVLDSHVKEANRATTYMGAVDAALRSHGLSSRMRLVSLLDDSNRFTRYYAAQYLLALAPERARAEIEWNAKFGFDAISGDAGMALYALDNGIFKPD